MMVEEHAGRSVSFKWSVRDGRATKQEEQFISGRKLDTSYFCGFNDCF